MPRTPRIPGGWALCAALIMAGCKPDAARSRPAADAPAADTGEPEYLRPITGDSLLARGQSVWAANCRRCHGTGLVGAPVIATTAWEPRVRKGLDTLFQHALRGFEGPSGTQMPPRGGNPDLTDEDVKAAVRFMVTRYNPNIH